LLTTLGILEDKGYLEQDKNGRAFLGKPRVPRDQARQSAIGQILRSDERKSRRKLIKEAQ